MNVNAACRTNLQTLQGTVATTPRTSCTTTDSTQYFGGQNHIFPTNND